MKEEMTRTFRILQAPGSIMFLLPVVILLLITTPVMAYQPQPQRGAEGPDGVWSLELTESHRAVSLVSLDLHRANGQWDREVWGFAKRFNDAQHEGRIMQSSQGLDELRLVVGMRLNPDKWRPGGDANLTLEIQRTGMDLHGKFQGIFADRPVEGTIQGIIHADSPHTAGFEPVAAGEHPRLLVRRQDLPALRARAATPLGRKLVERLRVLLKDGDGYNPPRNQAPEALGYAMLYAATQDPAAAQTARARLKEISDISPDQVFPDSDLYDRPHAVLDFAAAYDLVYDTCNAAFRDSARKWLERSDDTLLVAADCTQFSPEPAGYCNGLFRSALGMSALVRLKDPGYFPPAPTAPRMTRVRTLPVHEAAAGVPVELLSPNTVPGHWLVAGPFPVTQPDSLSTLDRLASLRPVPGTTLQIGSREISFHPFDGQHLPAGDLPSGVAAPAVVSCYYTLVENPRPRWYQVALGHTHGRSELFFGGERLHDGDVVYAPWGRLPMLVAVSSDAADSARAASDPRLLPLEAGEASFLYTRRQQTYARDRQWWQQDYQEYLHDGHQDPEVRRLAMIAARSIRQYLSLSLGSQGWPAEGEDLMHETLNMAMPFALAYRSVTGVDLLQEHNLAEFLPLQVARTVYSSPLQLLSFGGGMSATTPDQFAQGFPFVPAPKKPAVLWAWNRATGLNTGRVEGVDSISAAVYTLLNYPLDLQPQNPDAVLPRVIVDQQKGGYLFRSQYHDSSDLIAELYAKSQAIQGAWWNTGDGAFRIYGLGYTWASTADKGRSRMDDRTGENVVQTAKYTNGSLGGHSTFFQSSKDGSGVVSLTLDNRYTDGSKDDDRIITSRSFAVDYSGASGAAGLYAIVDRAPANVQSTWQMNVGERLEARANGQTFTLTAPGGANLVGTFLTPVHLVVDEVDEVDSTLFLTFFEQDAPPHKRRIIHATGSGDYFVVMTLQKGPAPAVQAAGAGLASTVRVGRQTVTFDGNNLRLGMRDEG